MNALLNLFKRNITSKTATISVMFLLSCSHLTNLHASPKPFKVATQPSLIGKVFNDTNGNGYQDIFEEGIAGVRLATVTGLIIQTDGQGRYHVPDALGETQSWGRDFIIKLDQTTLPQGTMVTTENPRVIRFSNSGLNKANFGVRLP